jgi:hypothetical protein
MLQLRFTTLMSNSGIKLENDGLASLIHSLLLWSYLESRGHLALVDKNDTVRRY